MYRTASGVLCTIKRTPWITRRGTALLLTALLLAACASTGLHMVASQEMPETWERRIAGGAMGKADFAANELRNLDIWPRLADSGPVDYTPGCAEFLRRREKPLEVFTRFKVDEAGRVDSLTVLGDAFTCRKSTVEMVETFRFLPGRSGQQSLPSVVIYPVRFSVTKEGKNGSH